MNKIKEIYITLADFFQGLNHFVVAMLLGVLFTFAFYSFAIFVKKNNGENTEFKGVSTFFGFLVSLAIIALIISCLNY